MWAVRKNQARSKIKAKAKTEIPSKGQTGQPACMSKSIKKNPVKKSFNATIMAKDEAHKNGG
jgi:hypothetical protein